MDRKLGRALTLATFASATLLVGCGSSGGRDAAAIPTSTSVLPDGTVEVYEVDEDGEVVSILDAAQIDAIEAGSAGAGGSGSGAAAGSSGPGGSGGGSSGASGASGASGSPASGAGGGTASGSGAGSTGSGSGSGSGSGGTGGGTGGGTPSPAPGGGGSAPAPSGGDAPAPTPEPAPAPEPAPEPAPAPAVAPTVSVTGQRCSGSNLIISLTANASNEYRKGVRSVTVARQNEYGVFLTANASWLGPETGAGNVWNGTLVGNRQNIGKTLRVIATSDSGQSTTQEVAITAPC